MAPFGDRQTPGTICVAMMLMKGYKLEEIMDPTALLDEKKEIGQEYINHRQAGDVQWYVKTMYDGSIAMMDAFKKYVKEHKDELDEDDEDELPALRKSIICKEIFTWIIKLTILQQKHQRS